MNVILLANNTNTNTIIQIVHSAGNLFLILERRLVPDFLKEDFLLFTAGQVWCFLTESGYLNKTKTVRRNFLKKISIVTCCELCSTHTM